MALHFPTHRRSTGNGSSHSGGLLSESSFSALAAGADSMEDKLKLVETKRRCDAWLWAQHCHGLKQGAAEFEVALCTYVAATPNPCWA
jgi:hypothetical protein